MSDQRVYHVMKFKLLNIIICVLFIHNTFSQNLIPNFSFEEFYDCPEGYTQWKRSFELVPGWIFPTRGTSDYFNSCNNDIVNVPHNFAGRSFAKSGDAYMGMILKSVKPNYREYLQAKLILPLEKGKRYCFTMFYKLSTYSIFAVDRFGAFLSEDPIDEDIETDLKLHPQIELIADSFLINREQWAEMCGVYEARGGERFLTIGNFYSDSLTLQTDIDVTEIDSSFFQQCAYYFIDDITLHPIDDCYICSCDADKDFRIGIQKKDASNVDDPDGSIVLSLQGKGNPPYTIKWFHEDTGQVLLNLKPDDYIVMITDSKGCEYLKSIHIDLASGMGDLFQNTDIGIPIEIKNLYFEYDKAVILDTSFAILDTLYSLMDEYKETDIEVRGHTSSEGDNNYNLKLSENRAWAVVKYLIKKGVQPYRMTYKGFGESNPIADNSTEKGREKNRRVEFVIIRRNTVY